MQIEKQKAKKLEAKKNFGQHFLKNKSIINKIVQAVPRKYHQVYEIGPGRGALTQALHEKHDVIAVEIDGSCIEYLNAQENLWVGNKLQLIHADILGYEFTATEFACQDFCAVGNLPYNIGTQIIKKLLLANMECGVFMLQKEVTQRISGQDYCRLSVLIQSKYDIEKIVNVPKKDFTPQPKVESQVIKLQRHDRFHGDFAKLEEITSIMFQNPRKKLSNLNKNHAQLAQKLCALGIDLNLRAQQLPKEEYYRIVSCI